MEKLYTYLALGDSYTIGEAVLLTQNFPYQTVQLLRNAKLHIAPPEIIAKTGWTTDELMAAIQEHRFLKHYDFVSLLIGVNNQYRGRTVEEYSPGCAALIEKALEFADGRGERVVVLSIPDYGVTPFVKDKGMDPEKIAHEIDQFNAVARALAAQYKTHFIEITTGTREAASNASLIAEDGLHPSAAEYARWAEKLAALITESLK